jgi:flagellar motor switch protein FliN
MSQVSGQTASFEISAESLPAADSDVWYTVVAKGAVHGEMTLRLPTSSGTRLARKFLGEPEPAPVDTTAENITAETISAENKEAVEELLRQIAGLTSTALAATVGGEVQLHLAASAAPSWSSAACVCLQTRDEVGASVTIEIQISSALGAALQPRTTPATPSQQPSLQALPSTSTDFSVSSNYRRLMDVGLDVKLRFGSRRMSLRDVLALSAGVVVELENTLHSPVDLLLDGRLIAQGDVVIIDGKYGLRVTNVVDPPPVSESPA